jgi:hypothetical protein
MLAQAATAKVFFVFLAVAADAELSIDRLRRR